MKLEVGMYIRTDKGFIAKVKEFKHHYTKGTRLVDDYSVKEVVENYLSLDGNQCRLIESIDYSIPPCYPSDEELDEIKSHILKASYNIIDILEEGDYVNGIEIIKIYEKGDSFTGNHNYIFKEKTIEVCNDNYETIPHEALFINNEIETIVTKEQFEQMVYKVGDDK